MENIKKNNTPNKKTNLNSAGIVRRIDELGRIVIPKEIRKSMHIKNGEKLEIFIDKENIILKKYSELSHFKELSDNIATTLNTFLKAAVLISDTDKYISVSGQSKDQYLNTEISEDVLKYMNARKQVILKELFLTKTEKIKGLIIIQPIIASGDISGSIIIHSQKDLPENSINTINILTTILAKHLET